MGDATLFEMNLLRRSAPLLQWLLAALFLAAAAVVATNLVRELREATGDAAIPSGAPPPNGVPEGATRVPVLLFDDGKSVRVGDTAAHVAALLGRRAEIGRDAVHQTPAGEQLARYYEYRGNRFVLVFALALPQRKATVSAIYLEATSGSSGESLPMPYRRD